MSQLKLLKDQINGRSIFKKVIPTVNTLQRLFIRLDEINWAKDQLKNWEKPIYKAYHIETIRPLIINQSNTERSNVLKSHLLSTDVHQLGAHPICIYLIAFYLQQANNPSLKDFKNFCIENGISDRELSANAIWTVGINDGKFLELFNNQLEIIDLDFFIEWTKQSTSQSKEAIQQKIKRPTIKENEPNQSHLDYFLGLADENIVFKGPNTLKWAEFVCGTAYNYPKEFNQNFYRDDLLDYCNFKDTSNIFALLAVLSWGGMRRDHGRKLLQNPTEILDIVNKLRNNFFTTRAEAFDYIQQKRELGLLPGLGIGYYTKLICFLTPHLNGYIMDQWLGKSINLIFEKELIHIANDWVSNKNTAAIYEQFCLKIDYLASLINQSGYKTEERLFSVGGHTKGVWRQYVVDHYNKR